MGRIRLLGHVRVCGPDVDVRLQGRVPRLIMARLASSANTVVSQDRLQEAVWDDRPPPSARKTINAHVSRLRKALQDAGVEWRIETRDPGYLLIVDPEAVDAHRFERRLERAAAESARGKQALALEQLDEALAEWDGEALADCRTSEWARHEAERLESRRLDALVHRMRIAIELGRHNEALPQLARSSAEYPLSESLWELLILALYRCGRQADALQAYATIRHRLVEEFGLEPGPTLRGLQAAILAQHPDLTASPSSGKKRLGQLQVLKLAHLFGLIDADRDGLIHGGDFDRHARRFAELRGAPVEADGGGHIRTEQLGWWALICAGAGREHGDHLALADWYRFWSGWIGTIGDDATEDHEALHRVRQTSTRTFDALDGDGDGLINAEEYGQWLRSWWVDADAEGCFSRLDLDGDGVLTRDEAVQLLEEFFLSNDPEATGNHLYGPVF